MLESFFSRAAFGLLIAGAGFRFRSSRFGAGEREGEGESFTAAEVLLFAFAVDFDRWGNCIDRDGWGDWDSGEAFRERGAGVASIGGVSGTDTVRSRFEAASESSVTGRAESLVTCVDEWLLLCREVG